MVGINQFSNRIMIQNPDEFFGRRSELRSIFTRLQSLQSCDIFGERKIGKSSLLYHIYLTYKEKLGDEYKVVYIDLQKPKYHTVVGFLKYSLEELGSNGGAILSSRNLNENLMAYSDAIEKLRETSKPVLLIDECEKIANKTKGFNDEFIDTLRSLGYNGNIAYVTASLHSIKRLCMEGNFTSPFYNIFSEIPLAEFTSEETSEFISTKRDGVEFDDKESEFIKKLTNNHPLQLQISCYHVLENKGKEWNEKRLRKTIEKDFKIYKDGRSRKIRWFASLFKRGMFWLEKVVEKKIG